MTVADCGWKWQCWNPTHVNHLQLTSELFQHGKRSAIQATHIHKNDIQSVSLGNCTQCTSSTQHLRFFIFFLFFFIIFFYLTIPHTLPQSGIETTEWALYLALWSIFNGTSKIIKLPKKKHYPPMLSCGRSAASGSCPVELGQRQVRRCSRLTEWVVCNRTLSVGVDENLTVLNVHLEVNTLAVRSSNSQIRTDGDGRWSEHTLILKIRDSLTSEPSLGVSQLQVTATPDSGTPVVKTPLSDVSSGVGGPVHSAVAVQAFVSSLHAFTVASGDRDRAWGEPISKPGRSTGRSLVVRDTFPRFGVTACSLKPPDLPSGCHELRTTSPS